MIEPAHLAAMGATIKRKFVTRRWADCLADVLRGAGGIRVARLTRRLGRRLKDVISLLRAFANCVMALILVWELCAQARSQSFKFRFA